LALSELTSIKFTTYLEALAVEIRKVRSGEKTRLKLLGAGARLLDTVGYRDLNVEEISAEAGLAKGTFYIYFKTKDEFLQDLARRFVEFERQTMPQMAVRASRFANSLAFVSWYEKSFLRNAGILRCIIQMGETDDVVRALWHQRNGAVVDYVLDATLVRLQPGFDQKMLLLAIRTAGGMLDQSLFARTRVGTDTGQPQDQDPEFLCRLHSVMVYRALYGENPPAEEAGDILEAMAFPLRD
jgi:AcrR family transcriptional regulator